MNIAAIIWLILLVFFILVESSTVSLVSVWFAAGALVAMLAALLKAQLWLQVVLFFVVSALLLLALRPIIRKHFTPKLIKTNVDAVVGTVGIVTMDVDNLQGEGQVKLGGMEWTARSTDGSLICAGTQIVVDKIEGVKVFVTPVHAAVNK